MINLFHLKVSSREGIVFEGEVSSLSSYNEKGKFDILASHANFISLIKKSLTIRADGSDTDDKTNKGVTKEIAFDNALLRVQENKVEVYLGIEGMMEFK